MANANDYALRSRTAALSAAATEFVRDVGNGFMAASRLLVTLVGCVTLIGSAIVLANASWRDRVVEQVSVVMAQLVVPSLSTPEADQVAEQGGEGRAVKFDHSAEPQQRHVIAYLARRYRVADGALRPVVAAAYESGRERQLDPHLILAVMAVESSMNPFAQSAVGAQGLMQVMTRVHTDKFEEHGGEQAALDPIANIKVGSAILQDVVRRGGSIERGLQLYVGAGNLPDDGGYAARVLSERGRIALAATGKVDSALSAGLRADAARAEIRTSSAVLQPSAQAETLEPAPAKPSKPADQAV